MRNYELVVIYHPDLEIDLEKALKKVESVLTNAGGKVLFTESWGKRKLTYVIKKQSYGIYYYYELELDSTKLPDLEHHLNIADEVIRYLVTKPTPNFGDREKKMLDESEGDKSGSGEDTGDDRKTTRTKRVKEEEE